MDEQNPDMASDDAISSCGDALRDAVRAVTRAIGDGAPTAKDLRDALGLDPASARRIIRLVNEQGDGMVAITRAPKPANLRKFAGRARNQGVDRAACDALDRVIEDFDALIARAGSKGALTRSIRVDQDGEDAGG